MRFQKGYYFKKGMVVQQDFEKGRSHRLMSIVLDVPRGAQVCPMGDAT